MNNYDHGGDIYAGKDKLIDFSVNINPLGMPESVKRAAEEAIAGCGSYPDHSCRGLREAIARRYDTSADTVICGNGASDLIYRLFAAVKPQVTLLTAPAFSEYEKAALSYGGRVIRQQIKKEESYDITGNIPDGITGEVKLVFLCNPNNPTGRLISPDLLMEIMERCARHGILLAIDECFLELSEGWKDSMIKYVRDFKGLFILRAFTKDYAMPGLRLGYGFCSDRVLLDKMNAAGQPWSVSVPAEAAGTAACKEDGFLEISRAYIRREREALLSGLSGLGLEVTDSKTNFILFRAPGMTDLKEKMLKRGILIRSSTGFYGLTDDCYRVAVRSEDDNAKLLAALAAELNKSIQTV